MSAVDSPSLPPTVSFSHIHLYVDSMETLETYKALEAKLNNFSGVAASIVKDADAKCLIFHAWAHQAGLRTDCAAATPRPR